MVYLEHWLPCLFANMASLATWKRVTWRKSYNNGSLPLTNCKTLLAHLTLWIQSTKRECKLNPGTKISRSSLAFNILVISFSHSLWHQCLFLKRLQEHAYVVVIYMVSLLGELLLWYMPWPQTAWRGKDLFADTSTSPISTEVREGTKGKELMQQSME